MKNKYKKVNRWFPSSGKSDTVATEAYHQKSQEIILENEPSMCGSSFTDNAICLYGPVKIGKSKFASLIKDVYFIATEIGFTWLKIRKSYIPNWSTFKEFVKDVENKPKFIGSVKMFCIDTVSNLSKFCTQFVCGRENIAHPSDEEWGKGWDATQDEFMHWIMRLSQLGPGILFICHEREREIVSHSMKITKRYPDLIKSHYNVINPMCDMILRMDFAPHYKKDLTTKQKDKEVFTVERCIYTKPTDTIEAGDRTGILPDIIFFDKEVNALRKITGYFE